MTACLGLYDAVRGLFLTGAVCLMAQLVSLWKHERQRRDERERAPMKRYLRRNDGW